MTTATSPLFNLVGTEVPRPRPDEIMAVRMGTVGLKLHAMIPTVPVAHGDRTTSTTNSHRIELDAHVVQQNDEVVELEAAS